MNWTQLIGEAILSQGADRDKHEGRITCKLAASQRITCQWCPSILDQRTVTVIEHTSRSGDTRPTHILCPACADAADVKGAIDGIRDSLQGTVKVWDGRTLWD